MSTALPQSQLGKLITKPLVDGFAKIDIANPEALKILELSPVDTVWGRSSGRPIYDRLPGVSEAYKEEFFGEVGRGLVFIEPQFGTRQGPGSLEVGAWEKDQRVLIINSGVITWAYGQVPTDTLAVNLETVIPDGIQDGSYQVGYYLNRISPDVVRFSKYQVDDYSLGASRTVYDASSEAKYKPVLSMFSEPEDGSWSPGEFAEAGDYENGSSVTMDFTEKVIAQRFVLTASSPVVATARCALYSSDDAIVWNLEDIKSPRDGSWEMICGTDEGARYYRLFFWEGKVDVAEVKYSGEAIFQNQRPTGFFSEAEVFLEGEYDEITRPNIVLAIITVSNYRITEIRDVRTQTSRKYEPVASWLTDFQDTSLRSLITSIEGYAPLYLSPPTSGDLFYTQLLEENFTLGPDVDTPKIDFPSSIELAGPFTVVGEPRLETNPLGEELTTDPSGFFLVGQEVPFLFSDSSVEPTYIIGLGNPVNPGDLATKAYIDSTLIPTFDNGKF